MTIDGRCCCRGCNYLSSPNQSAQFPIRIQRSTDASNAATAVNATPPFVANLDKSIGAVPDANAAAAPRPPFLDKSIGAIPNPNPAIDERCCNTAAATAPAFAREPSPNRPAQFRRYRVLPRESPREKKHVDISTQKTARNSRLAAQNPPIPNERNARITGDPVTADSGALLTSEISAPAQALPPPLVTYARIRGLPGEIPQPRGSGQTANHATAATAAHVNHLSPCRPMAADAARGAVEHRKSGGRITIGREATGRHLGAVTRRGAIAKLLLLCIPIYVARIIYVYIIRYQFGDKRKHH